MNEKHQPKYKLMAEYFVMDKDPYYICSQPEQLKEILQKDLPELWYWVAHGRMYWHRQKFNVTFWDQFNDDNLERLLKISEEEIPLIFVEEKELKKFLSAAEMIGLYLSKIGQMRKETVMRVVS